MAFFDIVEEQQNIEKIVTHELIGCGFLGEQIVIDANTSYMFNLIVSMSEDINALSSPNVTIDFSDIDTDSIVDELDLDNIQKLNDTKLKEKLFADSKEGIKQQIKEQMKQSKVGNFDTTKEEDKIYEQYFFKLPGVPSKEEFINKILECKGMEVNEENFKTFEKVLLINKEDTNGKLMNLYETNLFYVKQIVTDVFNITNDFNRKTNGKVDSGF